MNKYLFIVQGEGRGHLMQAIALSEILTNAGHELVAVMVGIAADKAIPDFFYEKIDSEIISFLSPSIVYNPKTKALDTSKTLINNILCLKKAIQSIKKIDKVIRIFKPDIIINFYDILAGIHQIVYRPKAKMFSIAHQYLLLHKGFVYPQNNSFDKFLVNLNTKLTALGSTKILALSFDKLPNDENQNIVVVPPLLRKEVSDNIHKIENDGFILVYMTIPSMTDDLIKWHVKNQHILVHCFCNNPQANEEFRYSSTTLVFHKINPDKFLFMLTKCAGLATTAGFESVCEAMSFGKPVIMIPIPKHFEQSCNAFDGVRANAGISGKTFDLTFFIKFLPQYNDISTKFNEWENQANMLFLNELVPKNQCNNEGIEYNFENITYATIT